MSSWVWFVYHLVRNIVTIFLNHFHLHLHLLLVRHLNWSCQIDVRSLRCNSSFIHWVSRCIFTHHTIHDWWCRLILQWLQNSLRFLMIRNNRRIISKIILVWQHTLWSILWLGMLWLHLNVIILHLFIALVQSHYLSCFVLLSHHVDSFLGTIKIKFVVLFLFLNFNTSNTISSRIILSWSNTTLVVTHTWVLVVSVFLQLGTESSILAVGTFHTWKEELFSSWWTVVLSASFTFHCWTTFWGNLVYIVDTVLH